MNIGAVVFEMSYLTMPGKSYTVNLYDKDRPLNPEADNPCARYRFVDSLGPFKSKWKAVQEAEAAVERGTK